jgi:hypothetical protein
MLRFESLTNSELAAFVTFCTRGMIEQGAVELGGLRVCVCVTEILGGSSAMLEQRVNKTRIKIRPRRRVLKENNTSEGTDCRSRGRWLTCKKVKGGQMAKKGVGEPLLVSGSSRHHVGLICRSIGRPDVSASIEGQGREWSVFRDANAGSSMATARHGTAWRSTAGL